MNVIKQFCPRAGKVLNRRIQGYCVGVIIEERSFVLRSINIPVCTKGVGWIDWSFLQKGYNFDFKKEKLQVI